MSAKHTPGPWKADGSHNVYAGRRMVALCGGYMDSSRPDETDAENEANARLITAAPELLEACKSLLVLCWATTETNGLVATLIIKKAHATVDKVEGIQP